VKNIHLREHSPTRQRDELASANAPDPENAASTARNAASGTRWTVGVLSSMSAAP